MQRTSIERYGAVSQVFHWLMAIIVLAAFLYGPGGSEQRVYSVAKDFDRRLHETLGVCVFVLVVLRLIWRTMAARPEPPQVARWMGLAADAAHWGLYLLMFALPLTAISGAWLEAHPLTLIGGTDIAPWLAQSHDLGKRLATAHTWLGDAIMWLAGLHALAALYHHVLLKDGVLLAMLPRWFPLRRRAG